MNKIYVFLLALYASGCVFFLVAGYVLIFISMLAGALIMGNAAVEVDS